MLASSRDARLATRNSSSRAPSLRAMLSRATASGANSAAQDSRGRPGLEAASRFGRPAWRADRIGCDDQAFAAEPHAEQHDGTDRTQAAHRRWTISRSIRLRTSASSRPTARCASVHFRRRKANMRRTPSKPTVAIVPSGGRAWLRPADGRRACGRLAHPLADGRQHRRRAVDDDRHRALRSFTASFRRSIHCRSIEAVIIPVMDRSGPPVAGGDDRGAVLRRLTRYSLSTKSPVRIDVARSRAGRKDRRRPHCGKVEQTIRPSLSTIERPLIQGTSIAVSAR